MFHIIINKSMFSSKKVQALQSDISMFPEANVLDSINGSLNSGTGVYITPSKNVPNRPSVTGYLLSSSNEDGKLEYIDPSSVGGLPSGVNGSIQFKDDNTLAGQSDFIWTGSNIGLNKQSPLDSTLDLVCQTNTPVVGDSFTIDQASLTITGVSSVFEDEFKPGDVISFSISDSTYDFRVSSIVDDLNLTIDGPYIGPSGQLQSLLKNDNFIRLEDKLGNPAFIVNSNGLLTLGSETDNPATNTQLLSINKIYTTEQFTTPRTIRINSDLEFESNTTQGVILSQSRLRINNNVDYDNTYQCNRYNVLHNGTGTVDNMVSTNIRLLNRSSGWK